MKLKLLSIFFVVLIAQMHVAQGTPVGLNLNLGGVIGAATNIITGGVTTVTSTINGAVSLLANALNVVVQTVGNIGAQASTQLSSAIGAGSKIIADGASIIANAGGDVLATVTTALTNAAVQSLPIIGTALTPITDFGNTVSKLLENKTTLLSNPISNINQAINSLTPTLASANPFESAKDLIAQGVAKAGENLQTVAAPLQNVLNTFSSVAMPAIDSGLNAAAAVVGSADNVLTAASDLTNALAAQVAAESQSISSSVIPITKALAGPVNNIVTAVNTVPAMINSAISAIQNSANSLHAACNGATQQIVSALGAVGSACTNVAISSTANLAGDATGQVISCITNEIPTLQIYLAQYQNLAAQYKNGISTNSISIATLQQTIQTSFNLKLYLLTLKFRIEGCIAASVLNAVGAFIPLAGSAVSCIG